MPDRSPAYRLILLLGINALVLFTIFNLAYWAAPALHLAIASGPTPPDPSGRLPNYAGIPWGEQHFRDMDRIARRPAPTDFQSFVGWRRRPFASETVNVEGAYRQRRTINSAGDEAGTAYFFGGSAMWGTGADDAGTIPSQFAGLTGMHAENFAEAGYTSHQSLMLLIQLLQEGRRPDLVVFYDGVNEVAIKCVRELTPDSHMLEAQIDALLKSPPPPPTSPAHYLAPIEHVARRVKDMLSAAGGVRQEGFDCHSRPEKAAAIADRLLRDWEMARRIAEDHGAVFVAALQPAIYFSRTRRDHLEDKPALMRAQFNAVYPLIRQRMAAGTVHDLTAALDVDDYVYVDFCHLSPNGNRLIAEHLAAIITRAP